MATGQSTPDVEWERQEPGWYTAEGLGAICKEWGSWATYPAPELIDSIGLDRNVFYGFPTLRDAKLWFKFQARKQASAPEGDALS